MSAAELRPEAMPRTWWLGLGAILALIAGLSGLYLQSQQAHIHAEAVERLELLGLATVDNLAESLRDQRNQVEGLIDRPLYAELVASVAGGPKPVWMDAYARRYGYKALAVFGADYRLVHCAPEVTVGCDASLNDAGLRLLERARVRRQPLSGQPQLVGGVATLDAVVPLLRDEVLVGYTLLRLDLDHELRQRLGPAALLGRGVDQRLLRLDGERAQLLLSRAQPRLGGLERSSGAADGDPVEARLVGGATGPLRGMGWQRSEVLATAHAVPDTDWTLVTLIDAAALEQMGAGERRAAVLIAALLAAGSILGMWLAWGRQRRRMERAVSAQLEQLVEERTRALRVEVEARRAAEAERDEYLEHHPLLIGRIDRSGQVLAMNRSWRQRCGVRPQQVAGLRLADLLAADAAAQAGAMLAAMPEAGSAECSCVLASADGPRLIEWSAVVDGEEIRLIGADRTDESAAAGAMRRFRQAIDAVSDPMALVDAETLRYVDVNRACCEATGYSRDELLTMGPTDLVAGLDAGQVVERYRAARERAPELQIEEVETRTADGRRFPVEVRRRYVEIDGRGLIVVIDRDLRPQREAEGELRLLQRAVAATGSALMICDLRQSDHPVVAINPAFTALTGYEPDEIVGQNPRLLFDDLAQTGLDVIREALRHGADGQAELRCRRRDGDVCWVQVNLAHVAADGDIPTHTVSVFTDVSEGYAHREQLRYLADHDGLTGLRNRSSTHRELGRLIERCAATDGRFALVFVDLINLKSVSDTLGHTVGDLALQELAERLGGLRGVEVTGRVGGDEFLLATRPGGDAEALVAAIGAVLAAPMPLGGNEIVLRGSMGVACYPEHGNSVEELLRVTDMAMHRAHQIGGGIVYYEPRFGNQLQRRLQLENALLTAAANGELSVAYQPLVSMHTDKVACVEALMRWTHPTMGFVSPGEFIPVAEESGAIHVIGRWVLEQACRQVLAWHQHGHTGLELAVNVSMRQIRRPGYAEEVAEVLAETGFPAQSLELEITESLFAENLEEIRVILDRLHSLGVRLSIDDFGTGYSSLSYIRRFPIKTLKIDASFVRDLPTAADACALTQSIIAMGQGLGLRIVAEGVETEGQLAFLRAHGCDIIQGYHFCRPQPAAAALAYIDGLAEHGCGPLGEAARAPSVLCVDDEGNVLTALERLFRRDGYRLLTATSGSEALGLLATNEVDVIISDQRMTGMTGSELLRAARALYPDCSRVLLTGYADIDTVTAAVNEGAVERFLTKPWEDDQLRADVREILRQRSLRRAVEGTA